MENNKEKKLLRIYISSTDKLKHKPLYEVIVFLARRNKLAGATVLRGIMGYGSSSKINSAKFWEITQKLPVIIEIIDDSDKIDSFFELIQKYLSKIPTGSLVTMEKINVIFHKLGRGKNKK